MRRPASCVALLCAVCPLIYAQEIPIRPPTEPPPAAVERPSPPVDPAPPDPALLSEKAPEEPIQERQLSRQQRGDIFMARKQYRDAIDIYREDYLDAWQRLPVIYNKIGIAYHQMNELELALEHYRNAVKFNPNYAEALNNIGTVFYAQRKYRDAERQYKVALKANPNSASIYSNLGTALFARKRYEEAAGAYQRALELDPEVFEHRGTGGVTMQERTLEERATFYYYLSKLYAKQGMLERSLQYMRRALEEGFTDRRKFEEEADFAPLHDNPEFQKLLVYQPRVL
jgi:tetratricopeptide (TPR) repeat protein